MKKILFTIVMFLCSLTVIHANEIDSIDMDIYIDEAGDAFITEIWSVDGTDGTEWYKVYNNLGNSKITDFKVYMDNKLLEYKEWDINDSLKGKKGYYGIVRTNTGVELCFGKYDYEPHTFKLEYKISNFIINTKDSQVIYWNLIDVLSNVKFKNFKVEVSSYYNFPDNLEVYGYGYKGSVYVENGKIKMFNKKSMDDKYVVLLVKFPINTFNTASDYIKYADFDSIYKLAENKSNNFSEILDKIGSYIAFLVVFLCPFILKYMTIEKYNFVKTKRGYINNKTITKENTPYFRDIPFNNDLLYANVLVYLNDFNKSETNILGALLLKWINIGKVTIIKDTTTKLKFNTEMDIEDENESKLFWMLYAASNDGILEKKELEKWGTKNAKRFSDMFKTLVNNKIYSLKKEGHLFKRKDKECYYPNVMDDIIYEDSKKLYGLKLFLEDFSNMKDKNAIDVKLWEHYLMYAFLFGIADKVVKELEDLFPNVFNNNDFINKYNDIDTIRHLNKLTIVSTRISRSANLSGSSYTSGRARSGGGGGARGGGGGGSR